jgi:hypothetical protein
VPDWSRRTIAGVVSRALTVGDNYSYPAASSGTPGGANTKGAWVQVLAACPIDADGFLLGFANNTGSPCDFLVDIGIGGAGSEVVLIPDLYLRANVNDQLGEKMFVPMAIPAGTRIAARCQNNTGSGNGPAPQVIPVKTGMDGVGGFQKCTAMGVVSASSRGTNITQDYQVDWVKIADPIPECKGFLFSCFPASNYTTNLDPPLIDIAIGPTGGSASHLIAAGWMHRAPLSNQAAGCLTGWWPIRLPGGSALFVRANGVGQAGKSVNAAVYGFS